MEQNKLRESNTNNKYQSSFLPKIERAKVMIMFLVVFFFMNYKSKRELNTRINAIIEKISKALPTELIDRELYIRALRVYAEKIVRNSYDKPLREFEQVQKVIKENARTQKLTDLPKIETPKQLQNVLNEPKQAEKLQLDMWAEQKGSVRVQNYGKMLDSYLGDVDRTKLVISEDGKRPITIWQKAELDIRHQTQLDKIEKLKEDGVKLAWISSHPNASKRCEKLQGHLVSLNEHAKNPQKEVKTNDYSDLKISTYRVGKVDGIWYYSLPDIMATKTKGGYNNMIISGFNCRHELIPYQEGKKPVQEYNAQDVAKQREIESKIREMEREIRKAKTEEQTLIASGRTKDANNLKRKIKWMTEQYKHYCEKNGYAWYQYRINI